MKGIVITTDSTMSVREFNQPLYKSVGEVVGGYIENVSPRALPSPYCMIVNEEGILKGLPINPVGSFLYLTHIHGSPILGDIVLMKYGLTSEGADIVGLDDDDIQILKEIVRAISPVKEAENND